MKDYAKLTLKERFDEYQKVYETICNLNDDILTKIDYNMCRLLELDDCMVKGFDDSVTRYEELFISLIKRWKSLSKSKLRLYSHNDNIH
jgi:hypothetical protein